MSAIDIICQFEGYRARPYVDTAGLWTVGYGSRWWNGHPVTSSYPSFVTEPRARAQIIPQVQGIENQIISACAPTTLTDGQLSALTSFAYNVGVGAFMNSTLRREVQAGNMEAAADQFLLWDKAGGQVSLGLLNRRREEQQVFLS